MEKKKRGFPWGLLILGILLVGGLWLCIASMDSYEYYGSIEGNVVKVTATVYDVYEGEFVPDEGHDYEYYVKYDWDGETYYNELSGSTGYSPRYKEGEKVTLRINSQDPMEIASTIQSEAVIMGCLGAVLLGAFAAFCGTIKAQPHVQDAYSGVLCARVADRRGWRFLGGAGLTLIVVFLRSDVLWLVIGIAALVLGVSGYLRMVKDLRLAKDGTYKMGSVQILGTKTGRDYDTPTYTLVLSLDGEHSWTQKVSAQVYNAAATGTSLKAVFLSGKKPEVLVDPTTNELF